MKPTLTADDAKGWYLCRHASNRKDVVRYWSGEELLVDGNPWVIDALTYTDFRLMVLDFEVTVFRTELASVERLLGEATRGAEQVNDELRKLRDECEELRKKWAAASKIIPPLIDEFKAEDAFNVCPYKHDELWTAIEAAVRKEIV